MPRPPITRDNAPAAVVEVVRALGENIATARTRRRLRQSDLAMRAGISKNTLMRVEAGEPTTSIGVYAAVLWALGLHAGLAEIASPETDVEGKTLEAARLGERVRPQNTLNDEF